MTILGIISLVLCIILIPTLIVLIIQFIKIVKRADFYLDTIEEYEKWINIFSKKINDGYENIKILDSRGAFEADDQVGYSFKQIKEILESLSNFIKE